MSPLFLCIFCAKLDARWTQSARIEMSFSVGSESPLSHRYTAFRPFPTILPICSCDNFLRMRNVRRLSLKYILSIFSSTSVFIIAKKVKIIR